MGTNLYARKIPNKKNLVKIATMVLEGKIGVAKATLNSYQDIHIGKRSAGWRFLFNHNNWEHYNNVVELKEWLKDYELYTEYETVENQDEFWKDVEARQVKFESARSKGNAQWYIFKDGYEFSTSTEFC